MGSGHVMRCLTLAEVLKENGASVFFISRAHEGNLNHLVSKKGMQVLELPKPTRVDINRESTNGDDYKAWLGVTEEQDAQETIDVIGVEKPDRLVVDHYALGEKWEIKIQPYVKNIMVIDDLANRRHHCDILLDQNWIEDMERRYDGLVPTGCTKLIGPKYVLLKPEFAEARKLLKPKNGKVEKIFIFFGGADPYNLTAMTLQALSDIRLVHLEVDVVIGENNIFREEIKKLIKSRNLSHLHIQIDNMASIMTKADLAIGAGGINTWERISLNIFSLVIITAQNQVNSNDNLSSLNLIRSLGFYDRVHQKMISDIVAENLIINNINNNNSLIDGLGCDRVKNQLCIQ